MVYRIIILGIVVICVVVINMNITERKSKNISVARKIYPECVTEGDNCTIEMKVENHNSTPIPCLVVREELPKELMFVGNANLKRAENGISHTSRYYMDKKQIRTRKYTIKALKRGTYIIKNLDIAVGSTLGLNVVEDKVYDFQELVVYPEVKSLSMFKFDITNFQGDNSVRRWIFKDNTYIKGIRDYRYEDRMKDVHWKASLKAGRLMVKEYDFTANEEMVIIVSVDSGNRYYDKRISEDELDQIIDISTALAWRAQRQGIDTGIWSNSQLISLNEVKNEIDAGPYNLKKILEYCARMTSQSMKPFCEYIDGKKTAFNNIYTYVIAAYYLDDDALGLIERLAGRGIKFKILDLSGNGSISKMPGIEIISYRGKMDDFITES